MGLLDDINTSTGEQYSKSYIPAGTHRLKLKTTQLKTGTAKNAGKEWFIADMEFLASSRADLPGCALNMPGVLFIETKPDGYDMAGNKIKNFLQALASDADLAGFDRTKLPADCVDPSSPYNGQAKGLTFGEFFLMLCRHNAGAGSVVEVIAVDKATKKGGTVTNYDWRKAGLPELEIQPAPLAQQPVQQPVQQPAATPQTAPVQQAPAQFQGGSIFGR